MKFLECYPFESVIPPIKLVEGCDRYVGYLGDRKGMLHKGIDYAREARKEQFLSFDVFSMHAGEAVQGESTKGWGRFVLVYTRINKTIYRTVYAHLRNVNPQIPFISEKIQKGKSGFVIKAGIFLGKAGISGWTKRKVQLHIELQREKNGKWEKIDPYGINGIAEQYPQPRESLKGLKHFWIEDKPPFVGVNV